MEGACLREGVQQEDSLSPGGVDLVPLHGHRTGAAQAKPEMVAKGPSCQMWKASLIILVRRNRSRCADVRSICGATIRLEHLALAHVLPNSSFVQFCTKLLQMSA